MRTAASGGFWGRGGRGSAADGKDGRRQERGWRPEVRGGQYFVLFEYTTVPFFRSMVSITSR
jgi:hypothetical protein